MVELNSKKLLVVDDSLIARMAITKMLSGKVASITEATNGSHAIEILRKESFDCILIDYLMPGIDGLTTVKIIRGMEVTTPIIVISANQQEAVMSKFDELDVAAILRKHVNPDDLLAALNKALDKVEGS